MSVKERIRIIRIIEKIDKNKAFSKRIGIHMVPWKEKKKKKNEIHRC